VAVDYCAFRLGTMNHTIKIDQVSIKESQELSQFLNDSAEATIFHTLEWNNILLEVFGAEFSILIAKQGGKVVGAFILNKTMALGPRTIYQSPNRAFETVYGGPVVVSGIDIQDSIKRELVRHLQAICNASMINVWLPPLANADIFREIGYEMTPFYTSVIDLEKDQDDLWRSIQPRTRTKIRKAEKLGVQILKEGRSFLPAYYQMVRETLGSQRLSVLPATFYERVMDILEPRAMAKLFIATHNGRAIGGAIFLFYKDTAYYWHGAAFREYAFACPNVLIQWELIKYAKRVGYRQYDLLSIEPDRLPGIARFKMHFGGETKTYYHGFWKTSSLSFPVLSYCVEHPSYLFARIRARVGN